MARNAFVRDLNDLSDDDEEAIKQITGALCGGEAVERRHAVAPPFERLRSYVFFKDREMWWKYYTACLKHEPTVAAMREADEKAMKKIEEQLEKGELRSVDDVDESFIVEVLVTAARDTRRPMARLKAAELLARMKGIDKPGGEVAPDSALEKLLDRALGRGTGPRGVVEAEGDEESDSGETRAG